MHGDGERRSLRSVLGACALAAAVAVPLASPAPGPAASIPGPEAGVAELNALRASVGVSPVTYDDTLSRGCKKHAKYHHLNPTQRVHTEDPALAGYTRAGDSAARSSVLVYGAAPNAVLGAWESTPYHRMALLHPRLVASGFWSEFGISCMQTTALDQNLRTPALTAYTYPASGQRDVATTFWCNERPNPCDLVRRSARTAPTGLNISVQFNGPWLRIEDVVVSSASVAAAGRPPVDLTVLTRQSVLNGGLVLIPHRPLRAGKTYGAAATGTVVARADDGTLAEYPFALSWDFSTPGTEPAASLKVVVERVTRSRVKLRVDLLGSEPRDARISLLNGRTALVRVTRRINGPSQRISLRRPRERVTSVGVLVRGGPQHVAMAARLATDIRAVSAPAPVIARGADAPFYLGGRTSNSAGPNVGPSSTDAVSESTTGPRASATAER